MTGHWDERIAEGCVCERREFTNKLAITMNALTAMTAFTLCNNNERSDSYDSIYSLQ
jgi:hypothetical protein